jgi:hypothetical protein
MTTDAMTAEMTDAQYRARLDASHRRVREHVLRHLAEAIHPMAGAVLRRKLRSLDRCYLAAVVDDLRTDGLIVVLAARGGGVDGVKYALVGRGGRSPRRLRNSDVPCDQPYCTRPRRPTGLYCGAHVTPESRTLVAGRLSGQ